MRRIFRQWSGIAGLIVLAWTIVFAGSATADQICDPMCELTLDDAHPLEALTEVMEAFGVHISIEGDVHDPITIVLEDSSVDQLVRRLGHAGGYLVGQQGHKYVFYGQNVEEVTIAIPLKHLTASDAGDRLEQFEEVEVFALPDVNALIVRGDSASVHRAKKFLETIDYHRPNVFLELLVVEYFHGDSFSWGYDIVNATKGKVSDLIIAPSAGAIQGQYDAITDLSKAFEFNLSALVQDQDARVVTNPHVAVRSGEPGKLDFQEELNIVLTNSTQSFGTTRRLETLTAGVMLNVTPQALGSDLIDLDIQGEVSVYVSAPEGQFAIDRQTIETKVLVKSGETLVIGGLIAKQVSNSEGGVPGLRRLPLLGYLFKGQNRSERFVETVVYITPYIDDPKFFQPAHIGKDVEKEFERADR